MTSVLNNLLGSTLRRDDKTYKLKEFIEILNKRSNQQYDLPIIVYIKSLNTYGKSIKGLLSKTNAFLLLSVSQLDSILSEYHYSADGRSHLHRPRLAIMPKKHPPKSNAKFHMKKLSRSLMTLPHGSQTTINGEDDGSDAEDDTPYNQRLILRHLNEKRSSANHLCRVPIEYQRFFELLNESDQPIEPCHILSELLIIKPDSEDPARHIEEWPHAFLLRSSCKAYTKKNTYEVPDSTRYDENSRNITTVGSIHTLLRPVESRRSLIELSDEVEELEAGQILTILNDCYAFRTRLSDKEQSELHVPTQPTSPSTSYSSPVSWMREKSRALFKGKRKSTSSADSVASENISNRPLPKRSEPYLKCRTQQGKFVYIFLHETGTFSPIYCQTNEFKSNVEPSPIDISGVLRLQDILSNFSLPVSVHLLDGSISFDGINPIATVNETDLSNNHKSKLRLMMQYTEQVVFACLLNLQQPKPHKNPSPCVVIPLSVDADIEIQPFINMSDIIKTDTFQRVVETCFQRIQEYRTDLSLINVPLDLKKSNDRPKEPLFKKRSRSVCNFEDASDDNTVPQDQNMNSTQLHPDPSIRGTVNVTSDRSIVQTITTDKQHHPKLKLSEYHAKVTQDNQLRFSQEKLAYDDEMYEDIDKIYDYIRTGSVTEDVQKIQAKEQMTNSYTYYNTPTPTTNVCLFKFQYLNDFSNFSF